MRSAIKRADVIEQKVTSDYARFEQERFTELYDAIQNPPSPKSRMVREKFMNDLKEIRKLEVMKESEARSK